MDIDDKIYLGLATLDDLDKVKTPKQAFEFCHGSIVSSACHITELQKIACQNSMYACYFAALINNADIEYCQVHACKDPEWAKWFALSVSGANIQYCQEHACKDPRWAYDFAKNIPNANIKYCQEYACKDPYYAYLFLLHISNADKEYCAIHACKNNKYLYKLLICKNIINKFNFDKCIDYINYLHKDLYLFFIARDVKNLPEDVQIKLVEYIDNLPNNITSPIARDKFKKIQMMKKACD